MIEVRNKLIKKSDHNGRLCSAIDENCPCRKCYRPHDFRKSYDDPHDMRCVNNYNHGCPDPVPQPDHIFSRKKCKRCGEIENK